MYVKILLWNLVGILITHLLYVLFYYGLFFPNITLIKKLGGCVDTQPPSFL